VIWSNGRGLSVEKTAAANPGEPTLEFLLGYQLWFVGEKVEARKWFDAAANFVRIENLAGGKASDKIDRYEFHRHIRRGNLRNVRLIGFKRPSWIST